MQTLNNKQLRHLRGLAHALKPVIMVGEKGLTQAVIDETINALEAHELIKIKVRAEEKDDRQQMIEQLTRKTNSYFIQQVGHIVTLFKRNKDPKIAIPK